MEYAAIFLPLIGSILGYFSKYIGNVFPLLITTLFVLISSVLSILIFYNGAIYNNYENHLVFEWISSGNFVSNWSINIDPLSSIMLVVVSFISFSREYASTTVTVASWWKVIDSLKESRSRKIKRNENHDLDRKYKV